MELNHYIERDSFKVFIISCSSVISRLLSSMRITLSGGSIHEKDKKIEQSSKWIYYLLPCFHIVMKNITFDFFPV